MATRDRELQFLLDELQAALREAAPAGSPAAQAIDRAFAGLAAPGVHGCTPPESAPVSRWLDVALHGAEATPVAGLAAALAAVAPRLAWRARPDRKSADPDFPNAHANAVFVGEGGLEERGDVRIGVSLLAPATVYPDHRHPPEEVYVALSDGEWRQEDGPWRGPGPGGLIYNPPDILHGMRSGDAPLLAIWTLPMGRAG